MMSLTLWLASMTDLKCRRPLMNQGFDERFPLFPQEDGNMLNRLDELYEKQAELHLLNTSVEHRLRYSRQNIRPLRLSEGGLFHDWESSMDNPL
jgi:hypothetical protein